MTVGERLHEALKRGETTVAAFQEQMAKRNSRGSSVASVYAYLSDKLEPPRDFLATAAEVLDVRAGWLAFEEGPMTVAEAEASAQAIVQVAARRTGSVEVDEPRLAQTLRAIQDAKSVSAELNAGRHAARDKATRESLRAERLSAVLRFAQRLDDVGRADVRAAVPWGLHAETAGARFILDPSEPAPPDYYSGSPRADLLAAAVRFLVRVEDAFEEAAQLRQSPLLERPVRRSYLDALIQREFASAGARAVWRDMILDLFATQVRGLGAETLPAAPARKAAPKPRRKRG